MCFDSQILKPFNQCFYTNVERTMKHLYSLGGYSIKAYFDQSNRVRLVIYDSSQSRPVSGLLLESLGKRSGYVIKGVYTLSNERRKGFAKLLLRTARQYVGKVRHSDNLTVEGELWMNAVEGIKNV